MGDEFKEWVSHYNEPSNSEYWKQKDREEMAKAVAQLNSIFGPSHKRKPIERVKKGIDPGYVYLLRCAETPYYKIGRTKNYPDSRINSIRGMCPLEIVGIRMIKTGNVSALENYLHRKFKGKNHHHEWFTFESPYEADKQFLQEVKSFEKWRKGE